MTWLRFRNEAEYRTAVTVLASDPWRDEDLKRLAADLRECARDEGAYVVSLSAALDAVRTERALMGKRKHKTKRGYSYGGTVAFWLRSSAPRTPRHRKGET